ncbi:hypothetical protein BLNAU_20106 [Blattamonas nauphoetae]|uniref:Uncharacterized protein n=1 Tax=Blattamonas nauphoetae TaxID=2049346 RepID=A0ABQ9WZJ4_9EUKA|nr:hypothetical protein BLNAU_20106 [Blattamonas nauphoetae]
MLMELVSGFSHQSAVKRQTDDAHTDQNPQSNQEKEDRGVSSVVESVRVRPTSARESFVIGQTLFKSRERESGVEIKMKRGRGAGDGRVWRAKGVFRFVSSPISCSEVGCVDVLSVMRLVVPLAMSKGQRVVSCGVVVERNEKRHRVSFAAAAKTNSDICTEKLFAENRTWQDDVNIHHCTEPPFKSQSVRSSPLRLCEWRRDRPFYLTPPDEERPAFLRFCRKGSVGREALLDVKSYSDSFLLFVTFFEREEGGSG